VADLQKGLELIRYVVVLIRYYFVMFITTDYVLRMTFQLRRESLFGIILSFGIILPTQNAHKVVVGFALQVSKSPIPRLHRHYRISAGV
jgi:capsule polysaccharide export protein KpsE/RkpR